MHKNFKVWKVVSVGSDGLAETQKGCDLLESLEETIDSAPPPVYAEQGQPRGRKPSAKPKAKGKKAKKSSKKGGTGEGQSFAKLGPVVLFLLTSMLLMPLVRMMGSHLQRLPKS